MTKVRTWRGLDVHAAATVACVVDARSGEMSVHRLPGRTSEVAAFCAQLPAPVRVAYEAGPTGFEPARALERPGQLISYLGLVPSENSSGQTRRRRRQGAITKSGSRHARRLLVEAAWH
jgi:transposase